MEIGRIKWAGHYNSQTGDYNNYGFITRLINNEDIYFRKESVKSGSRLSVLFNDCDDRCVVYELAPSPKKTSQYVAVEIQFLEEINADSLMKSLSPECRASQRIQRVLLEIYPDAILGDDPAAYIPLLQNRKVKSAFVDRYESKRFRLSIPIAFRKFFESGNTSSWNATNWELINWSKENKNEVRDMCCSAIRAGINIAPLFISDPALWRNDPSFVSKIPLESFITILSKQGFALSREDFAYLVPSVQNDKIRELLCGKVPLEWVAASPQFVIYLSDDNLLKLLNSIDWDKTETAYVEETGIFLAEIQKSSNDKIDSALAAAVENAWIIEDSPWWNKLSRWIQERVLRDYRKAGLITESNATDNPLLEQFLSSYYVGKQSRKFSVQQKEAIQSIKGITLLFAVPGSGKTTVIVARAGFMAHAMRIDPHCHLIMTFNKAAAQEMESRYKEIYTEDGENIPDFRTIHSFCFNVIASLREKGETFPLLLKDPEDASDLQKKQKREREIAAAVCSVHSNNPDLAGFIQQIYEIRHKRISSEKAKNTICFGGLTLEEAWNSWQRKDITQKAILRKVMNTEAYDEDANTLIDTIATLIGFIKNRMLSPEEIRKITYKVEKQDKPIEPIYTAYQQYLKTENLMDYDDMLYRAYEGLKKYNDILKKYQDRYPYVSLDEAQDTSLLQHEIVGLLVQKHRNLFMVGDDDQSIYAFRGAVPTEMLDFQKRYHEGTKLLMGTNYRSDTDIVRSADRFVRVNERRENKLMRPSSDKKGSIQLVLLPNLSAQYEYITNAALQCKNANEELAVLFRWNISALPVMAYFYQNRIPFRCSKQKEAVESVLTKQEVKRIINLLRYSRNLSNIRFFKDAWFVCYRNSIKKENLNEIEQIWMEGKSKTVADAVIQFLNKCNLTDKVTEFRNAHNKILSISASAPRAAIAFMMKQSEYGILSQDGDDSISTWMRVYAILSAAEACKDIDGFLQMVDDMQGTAKWHEDNKRIRLSAMHSAKGAEFDRVIIIDTLDDITPGPETGNDVWYDPEEERRLFYVAVTRAKHELDILQVDIYHDRHQKPSRFIGDLHATNPNIEVVSYSDSKKRSMIRFNMPHYIIRQGSCAGIYNNEDEIEEIREKNPMVRVTRKESYADAIVYMHKGDIELKRDTLQVPTDLSLELQKRIWGLFGVRSIDDLSGSELERIRRNTELFMETNVTDYSGCAREYALMYLPVNVYKVWRPLIEMLPSGKLPVDGEIKILEFGAGPGTATLGLLSFYYELAKLNPQRSFKIDYQIIEREPAFIDVFSKLYHEERLGNFSVTMHKPICEDVTKGIKHFSGREMDLILESNMLNPNEHIQDSQLTELVSDVCKALRNYGSFLMIEPEGPEMMVHLRSVVKSANKTDSLLHESVVCDRASVDVTNMKTVQDVIRKGLRVKAIEAHGFSYALLERKDIEVRSK